MDSLASELITKQIQVCFSHQSNKSQYHRQQRNPPAEARRNCLLNEMLSNKLWKSNPPCQYLEELTHIRSARRCKFWVCHITLRGEFPWFTLENWSLLCGARAGVLLILAFINTYIGYETYCSEWCKGLLDILHFTFTAVSSKCVTKRSRETADTRSH